MTHPRIWSGRRQPPRPDVKAASGTPWPTALRNRPGQWACLGRGIPTGIITTINQGALKCFKPVGSFEAVTRNHTNRWEADVYARYVGENGEYA